MSLRIQTFEEYQETYKRSVNNPEAFWAAIADHFVWKNLNSGLYFLLSKKIRNFYRKYFERLSHSNSFK